MEIKHYPRHLDAAGILRRRAELQNAARLYGINPDNALERTNSKFIRRFNYLEDHTLKAGRKLTDMTLAEMDAIWEEAKKYENKSNEKL